MNNNTKTHHIYKITNTVNGKCYVGQTTNLRHRFYKSHYARNKALLADIEKYGASAFTIEVIASTTDSKFATSLEEHFVKEFNCIENGYNRSHNFKVPVGLRRTAAANRKRREAISNTIWMTDPTTGQTTRANPTRANELRASGWKDGRLRNAQSFFQSSLQNKILPTKPSVALMTISQ